ncbi:MAG: enoyl-CoA hydratase/isomerase family protein [Acidimicrobiales bacterium]|nr:enoyl-CoA hydratase/isomerase family protein [Acidimicrobiales bacterium]
MKIAPLPSYTSLDLEYIEVTTQGPIGVMTMNQPDRHNALNPELSEREMHHVLGLFHRDDSIRVVVITGKGRSFCAGGSLTGMKMPDDVKPRSQGMKLAYQYDYGLLWKTLQEYKKPLIAAVNGHALGGGWALAHICDLVIAAEAADFGAVEVNVGLISYEFSCNWLAKTVGKHRAMNLVLTGDRISAREALELGLVNQVVPDDQLMNVTLEKARQIASRPPLAVALAKHLVQRAVKADEDHDLERAYGLFLRTTEDFARASAALAAREPVPEFFAR